MKLWNNATSKQWRSCRIALLLFLVGGWTLWNTVDLRESIMWRFQTNNASKDESTIESHKDESSNDASLSEEVSLDKEMSQLIETKKIESSTLPDALQPVTFIGCCPKEVGMYAQTCLTERACDKDTLYPFSSHEEVRMFTKYMPSKREKLKMRERCSAANAQLRPQVKWCRSNTTTNHDFPMGCSHLTMAGGSGPYDRLLLYPQGKLAFCAIPKAGITQWLQFLRFTLGAKDYQSMPYFKKDSKHFHLDKLQPAVQEEIWNSDEWTRAILIREPAERLLSAYLDKVALKLEKRTSRGRNAKRMNKRNKRRNRNRKRNRLANQEQPRLLQANIPFGPNVTFAEFVNILAMEKVTKLSKEYRSNTGLSWRTDPHWRPQAWSCGLSENMPHFDYIGSLDNAAYHSKAILEKVDMWDTYGKHYRVSERGETKGSDAATWPPPPGEEAIGFQQQGANANDRHNKDSRSKLDKYYTPDLMKKVRKLYWMDFALWDALQEAEKEGKTHGRDIARKLNPECA